MQSKVMDVKNILHNMREVNCIDFILINNNKIADNQECNKSNT